MKEIKIIVDGKEITAQVSEEVLKTLLPELTLTGFERSNRKEEYYRALVSGGIVRCFETQSGIDAKQWEDADYYSNKSVAEWCAKADNLMRRIRRYAALQNAQVPPEFRGSYVLWFRAGGTLGITKEPRYPFTPMFYSIEAAKAARDVFGKELNELYSSCPAYI